MQLQRPAQILLISLVALLAACAVTPKQRIEREPAAFAALSAEQQEQVRQGSIAVGFDAAAVRLALGPPDRVVERESGDGASEVWTYYSVVAGSGFASPCGYGYGYGYGYGFPYYARPAYCPPPLNQYEERMRVVFKDGKVASLERVK